MGEPRKRRKMELIKVFVEPQYRPDLCCATDESRPSLAGVQIDPTGWIVGGDGFCIAVVSEAVAKPS